ncbi:MAG TPA: P22 phage major capsid protein family protein, partial [Paraburkholderia sp.]|uniref:P22 phage major capsid protein family protein n=1 Tax=Paraburkholderia sp. TaxID=1926495 RepID=UPI002ED50DAE
MNTFISPNWVSTDVAMFWQNNIKLVAMFDRTWEGMWKDKPDGAQIGYTAQVRIPQRFRVKRGQALQQQAILNQTVPVSLTDQLQVAMGWSSADDALLVEEVQSRYTKPAGKALANECDVFAGNQVYKSVFYSIGAPGVPITDNEAWTDGVAMLRAFGVPDELYAVTTPQQQSKLVANNLALFNPQAQISEIFKSGLFATGALGVNEWAWDSNMPTHTTGSFTASTPAVAGGNQSGSTLSIDGMGTYALKEGDVFTIDGVYGVNPISYSDTQILQQFVLTADVSGSSTATLSFSPSLIADTNSQLQTVTNLPANDAAISFLGSTGTVGATMTATRSKQNIVCNPAAFAWVMADLPVKLAGAVAG